MDTERAGPFGGDGSMRLLFVILLLFSHNAVAGSVLSGEVVDETGQPVASAHVMLYYFHDISGFGSVPLAKARTGEEGRFQLEKGKIEIPPIALSRRVMMQLFLIALAPGKAAGAAEVLPEKTDNYRLELSEGRNIICRAVEHGRHGGGKKRVKDAKISVADFGSWGPAGVFFERGIVSRLLNDFYSATSDADGLAEIQNVPQSNIRVRGSHENFLVWPAISRVNNGEAELRMREHPLFFGATKGIVKSADNDDPIKGVLVMSPLHHRAAAGGWDKTDEAGQFQLSLNSPMARRHGLILRDPSYDPHWATRMTPGKNPRDFMRRRINRAKEAGGNAETDEFMLERGKQISISVINTITKKPVDKAIVALKFSRNRQRARQHRFYFRASFCRVTGQDGCCHYRVPEDQTEVDVSIVDAFDGGVIGQERTNKIQLEGAENQATVGVGLVEPVNCELVVREKEGQIVPRTRLWLRTIASRRVLEGLTASDGRARLAKLIPGEKMKVCAISPEGRMAAFEDLQAPEKKVGGTFLIRLQKALSGEIILKDNEGEILDDGRLWIYVKDHAKSMLFRPDEGLIEEKTDGHFAIKALLPGVNYIIRAHARGYRQEHDGGVKWMIKAGETKPKKVVVLEKIPRDRRHVNRGNVVRARQNVGRTPEPVPPEKEYKRDLATLEDAERALPDTVQKYLTWYVDDHGIALADKKKRKVYRFPGLLGFEEIDVREFAFGVKKVWVATDKGLIGWDRKQRFWTRFAPEIEKLNAPAKSVSVEKDSSVRVVLQLGEGEQGIYRYDPRDRRWHKE